MAPNILEIVIERKHEELNVKVQQLAFNINDVRIGNASGCLDSDSHLNVIEM